MEPKIQRRSHDHGSPTLHTHTQIVPLAETYFLGKAKRHTDLARLSPISNSICFQVPTQIFQLLLSHLPKLRKPQKLGPIGVQIYNSTGTFIKELGTGTTTCTSHERVQLPCKESAKHTSHCYQQRVKGKSNRLFCEQLH